ncbi:HU family DNA-binding protein [Gemmobacter aquatilis]|nr:HU family DNA-binding protein [Gemmobacter aquatilis]
MAKKPANAKPAASSAPRARRSPAARPGPRAKAAALAEAAGADPVLTGDAPEGLPEVTVTPAGEVLKTKDLVTLVVQATGINRKGVREVVDATLAAIGDALSKGQDLNLPPLGKAKVGRQKGKTDGDGELLVVKLKRGGEKKPGKKAGKKDVTEGVAEAEE